MRHRMEFHKFSMNQNTHLLEVARMVLDAPRGTSIFQTPSEYKYSMENKEKYESKYRSMMEKIKGKSSSKPLTPCRTDAKIWSKMLIAEPKPKKDTYFCWIWNDDYNSYISHIGTNQHKLSSYSENLAEYYEKIDTVITQVTEDMHSPKKESISYSDQSEKVSTPDTKHKKLENHLSSLNQMIDDILYKEKPKVLKKPGKVSTYLSPSIIKSPLPAKESEDQLDYKTARFNEVEKSESVEWHSGFGGSSIKIDKPIQNEKVKEVSESEMTLKPNPEISMTIIEPANQTSPQKAQNLNLIREESVALNSIIKSEYEEWPNTPQQISEPNHNNNENLVKIDRLSNLKTPKSDKNTSKGTPEFHKFSKFALGIEPSNIKNFDSRVDETVLSEWGSSSNHWDSKFLTKSDNATASACKSLMKSNKIELVGIFVSGKQLPCTSLTQRIGKSKFQGNVNLMEKANEKGIKRHSKSVRKQLESIFISDSSF